jgi:two-component system OmpR family response regulator
MLVVDDDPLVRELLTTRLSIAGYEAHHARDGFEGLNRLAELRPAGMILDINMPGLDGFDVLETLRRTNKVGSVRIMVLTARNQTADVQRAIGLGARDYLAKPFTDAQFLSRVTRLMRGAWY